MRRRTVKSGLHLLSGAVISVILAAFFHEQIASLLFLSPSGEAQFIYLGLFWGGVLGFCGILVTVIGLLRAPGGEGRQSLLPSLVTLVAVILVFFLLLFFSFKEAGQPRLRPGETLTI